MLFLALTVAFFGLGFSRDCSSPPEMGFLCREHAPSLRYYFDEEHMNCYPFKHNGCDTGEGPIRIAAPGTKNGYPDVNACFQSCMPMDFNSCGYSIKSTGTCSHRGPGRPQDCRPSDECHYGAFFGICCPKDKVERAQNPKCPAGKKAIKNKEGYGHLVSKSCRLDFCPAGTTCIDGEFYAYCCE